MKASGLGMLATAISLAATTWAGADFLAWQQQFGGGLPAASTAALCTRKPRQCHEST